MRVRERIEVMTVFTKEEVNQIKTEEDVDKLFKEKTDLTLHNLKVDIKKELKRRNKCLNKESVPVNSTTPVFLPSSSVVKSIIGE